MSGPKTSTSTQNTQSSSQSQRTPWDAAASFFPSLYQTGAGAVANNQTLPVPQQFVAGENPTEVSALSQTLSAAPSLGASGASLSDMAKKISSGFFLDPSNDPTFAGAANAALTPLLQNTQEKLLPQITDAAIRGGGTGSGPSAYGGANAGSAQDIENERVLRDFAQTGGNITAGMANASRMAGMNLIPQAGNIAAQANQQILAPATATGAVGTQQQTFAQQAINDLLQKYSTNLAAPWQGLQPFANLLTTGGFGNTNTTGTTNMQGTQTTPPPDLATQILQGITGGVGMANSIGGKDGIFPGGIQSLFKAAGPLALA